jgi:L-ascorbate metabolism protein UlaG (beta-lactamase superfamily)
MQSFILKSTQWFVSLLVVILLSASATVNADSSNGKATFEWMGHSSFKLTTPEGKVILIDPWISTNPSRPDKYRDFKGLDRVDLILITHGHVDHFMTPDLKVLIEKFNPDFIGAWEMQFLMKSLFPGSKQLTFQLANIGGVFDYHGTRITMTAASHSGGVQFDKMAGKNQYAGDAVGYVLEFSNGIKVYHAGDTGLMASMETVIGDFYQPDIAILPIGGVFTMGPKEAAYANKLIGAKYVIPQHYGSFPVLEQNADSFVEYLKHYAPDAEALVIKPGEEIHF